MCILSHTLSLYFEEDVGLIDVMRVKIQYSEQDCEFHVQCLLCICRSASPSDM